MRYKFLKFLVAVCLGCNIVFAATPTQEELEHSFPHFARLTNGVIEYYDIGQGSPIVLISGYSSTVRSWDSQFVAGLAARHRVILFDNRGTGNSVIHSGSYNSKDLANDTYDLVRHLHLNKPVILGISMGGMIAQQYAVLHPDAMSKLVLINTAIAGEAAVPPSLNVQKEMFTQAHGLELYIRAIKLFFPPEWQSRMALAVLHDRFGSVYFAEKPAKPAVLLKQQKLIRAWHKDNNTEKQLANLPMPVLVLNGGEDIVIPPVNSNILERIIPHAKLLRWAQGGHCMIYQFPYSIAGAINRFVAR